jgi:hypothetical protein
LIYIDSSVVLAQVLAEDRRAPAVLWDEPLVSSRLLTYEVWTRVNAKRLATADKEAVQQILDRISFLELSPIVLERALEPFPIAVRTLDALHLGSMAYLHERRTHVELATYDERMAAAARRLRLRLYDLP